MGKLVIITEKDFDIGGEFITSILGIFADTESVQKEIISRCNIRKPEYEFYAKHTQKQFDSMIKFVSEYDIKPFINDNNTYVIYINSKKDSFVTLYIVPEQYIPFISINNCSGLQLRNGKHINSFVYN